METMIGHPTDSVINRFEDLTPGVGMRARRREAGVGSPLPSHEP